VPVEPRMHGADGCRNVAHDRRAEAVFQRFSHVRVCCTA
jgi:hypothetical protein